MRSTWFPTRVGSNLARRQPGWKPVRHEAWGAQHGWATNYLKRDRKTFVQKTEWVSVLLQKVRSFKTSWTTMAVMSVKCNVRAISTSFISWLCFTPTCVYVRKDIGQRQKILAKKNVKKSPKKSFTSWVWFPHSPPTCVCIRMEYPRPRLPYILSSNDHYTTIYQHFLRSTKTNTSRASLYTLLYSTAVQYVTNYFCIWCW